MKSASEIISVETTRKFSSFVHEPFCIKYATNYIFFFFFFFVSFASFDRRANHLKWNYENRKSRDRTKAVEMIFLMNIHRLTERNIENEKKENLLLLSKVNS